jgi:hypothetical protein
MEIDINYALVHYTTNVNIYEFHWKGYGMAIWYDTRLEERKDARKRLKDMVWEDIFFDNPQLVGTDVKFIESGEMPIIQERDR